MILCLPKLKMRLPFGVWALCLTLLLFGCSQYQQGELAKELKGDGKSAAGGDLAAGKLEKGDKLRVNVFNEPQLSGEFVVEGTGTIAYPLIGSVEVAGLNAREVEQRLTQKLSGRYLVNPKISAEVVSQRPFYIVGEVVRSGEYAYKPGLNVVSAIALAGGYGPRATTSYVLIRRANEMTQKQYPILPSVVIYPGDMITVPERYF
jgi:protein involved in polysaccharide export with SLBB domain